MGGGVPKQDGRDRAVGAGAGGGRSRLRRRWRGPRPSGFCVQEACWDFKGWLLAGEGVTDGARDAGGHAPGCAEADEEDEEADEGADCTLLKLEEGGFDAEAGEEKDVVQVWGDVDVAGAVESPPDHGGVCGAHSDVGEEEGGDLVVAATFSA